MTQNKFVNDFTKEETDAVTKLKASLPDILKTAFKSEGEPEPYKLWDIALDKDSTDERLDVLLVKFLRARELDLEAATKMLSDSIAWRREFKADTILDEEFDEAIFGSVGYIHEHDKEGRPVCYNFYGDLDQEKVFGDPEKFIRWRVQLMEKGVKLVDFVNVDSMIQVHDYKGASMFGRTANAKAATKDIIKIMQDNYPEFLATKYFVNVPWWGSKIFKLVRPLLPEATVKKFIVCSNDELIDTLSEKIPVENLPAVYTASSSSESQRATTTTSAAAATPKEEESKVQEEQSKEADTRAADKKEDAEVSTSAKNEAAAEEEKTTSKSANDEEEPTKKEEEPTKKEEEPTKKEEEPISKKAEKQPATASESNDA